MKCSRFEYVLSKPNYCYCYNLYLVDHYLLNGSMKLAEN